MQFTYAIGTFGNYFNHIMSSIMLDYKIKLNIRKQKSPLQPRVYDKKAWTEY